VILPFPVHSTSYQNKIETATPRCQTLPACITFYSHTQWEIIPTFKEVLLFPNIRMEILTLGTQITPTIRFEILTLGTIHHTYRISHITLNDHNTIHNLQRTQPHGRRAKATNLACRSLWCR